MVAPAVARAEDVPRRRREDLRRFDLKTWAFILSIAVQLVIGGIAYGKLVERVDNLRDGLIELRTIVLQKR